MKTIGIINHKGGVGKSTLTANLGACLTQRQNKTLLIDMDPQGSLTIACGINPDSIENNIADLMVKVIENKPYDIKDYIVKNEEGILLIPSGQELTRVDLRLHQELGREYVLNNALKQLSKHNFDFVLIDSPPFISLLTINILSIEHLGVLIPISPDFLSFKAFSILGESLSNIKAKTNNSLNIIGLVFNFADLRTFHAKNLIDFTKKTFGQDTYIFNSIIRAHTGIKEAQIKGQSITAYSPDSIGSADYNAFVNEFLEVLSNGKK